MMSQGLQTAVTFAIVGTAVGYLAFRLINWWRKPASGGCGSACKGCTSDKSLVQLDLTAPPRGNR